MPRSVGTKIIPLAEPASGVGYTPPQ